MAEDRSQPWQGKEYKPDNWHWDQDNKSCEVQLSQDHLAAYFHIDPVYESLGTAGVRGTKGFMEGEYYWEITFTEPPYGTAVMIGVGSKRAKLHTADYQYINMIGIDSESWGLSYKGTIWHGGRSEEYCAPFYGSTVIGVWLNLSDGTLTFYKNGQSLGVAFTGLDTLGEELYPLVCSTAPLTELELGVRSKRMCTLQEKCYSAIVKSISQQQSVDLLPLPGRMKGYLRDRTSGRTPYPHSTSPPLTGNQSSGEDDDDNMSTHSDQY